MNTMLPFYTDTRAENVVVAAAAVCWLVFNLSYEVERDMHKFAYCV